VRSGTKAVVTAREILRLDGFQLIARIRREATLRRLPIIVLSSCTSQAARDRVLTAGANVLLPKSRHRRSLVAAVTAYLRQQRFYGWRFLLFRPTGFALWGNRSRIHRSDRCNR
jgi:DNA-binding response OmpR family regulator